MDKEQILLIKSYSYIVEDYLSGTEYDNWQKLNLSELFDLFFISAMSESIEEVLIKLTKLRKDLFSSRNKGKHVALCNGLKRGMTYAKHFKNCFQVMSSEKEN